MKKIFPVAILALGLSCANIYADTNINPKNSNQGSTVKSIAEKNLQAGQEFLAKNKKLPGVITLADGLQYKIDKVGTGPKPTASDTVVVHYSGKLPNGKEFDSSYKRGEPATFPVNAVIPGWTEALQLMPVGSKWELFIPANLSYGTQSIPPDIGPNQVLTFTVELLDIKK